MAGDLYIEISICPAVQLRWLKS